MHCDNCNAEIEYDENSDVFRDKYGNPWCAGVDINDTILHEIS